MKQKNNRLAFVALGLIIIVAIIIFFLSGGLTQGSSSQSLENDGSENQVANAEDDEEETESIKEENGYKLEYSDNQYADESSCLSVDDYKVVYESDFSFAYPKYIFNDSWYDKDTGRYEFWYNDDYWMSVEVNNCEYSDGWESAHSYYLNSMSEVDRTYYDSDAKAIDGTNLYRTLIGGSYDSISHGVYKIMASDGNKDYILTIEYPDNDIDDYYKDVNYIVDCVYRYCSFSGSNYIPRSHSQFLRDERGTKK